MSSTGTQILTRNNHLHFDVDYPKSQQNEMTPPIIFNSTSSSKYLHKKFKRIASTVIEDNNCDKIEPNVNNQLVEDFRFYGGAITDCGKLHINEQCQDRLTNHKSNDKLNSRDGFVNCVRCQRPFKYDEKILREMLCSNCCVDNNVSAQAFDQNCLNLRRDAICDVSKVSIQSSRSSTSAPSSVGTELINLIENRNQNMISLLYNNETLSPLLQKTNKPYGYDPMLDESRVKINSIHSTVPQNFKENFGKTSAMDYTVRELRASTINSGGNSGYNATATNENNRHVCTMCQFICNTKSKLLRHMRAQHNNEKPYPTGAELKIRHYRYVCTMDL